MRKKFIIGILIVLIIVVISLSTLALFTWTSPNTTLTLEVGEMTDVIFQEGNDIIANNIGPVLNYKDGEIIEFATINNAKNEQQAKFYLDISEISESLKEESFKYLLQTSTDGTNYITYKEGNFVSATTGELIIAEDEILPSGRTYYRFIIYIDGNMENPTSMMNNSLKATFNVELPPPTITVSELVDQMKNLSIGPRNNYSTFTIGSIYEAEDDYGTSYYLYRGDDTSYIENDYKIYFANNIWEIIRTNWNGSLRLMLDTTTREHNPNYEYYPSASFRSEYNTEGDDYAYVGYMYGATNANSYEEAHANINDSTIKQKIDDWYKTNIVDKKFAKYIEEDITFCNDRSRISYGKYDSSASSSMPPVEYNDFICPNIDNDGFSVTNATKGNKMLTYPVALPTFNEKYITTGYRANEFVGTTGNSIGHETTMTPDKEGIIYTTTEIRPVIPELNVTSARSIRPTLSLKSTTKLTLSNLYYNTYEVVYE